MARLCPCMPSCSWPDGLLFAHPHYPCTSEDCVEGHRWENLYRSITFTNGVISLDQDQITCAPKLIIWPPGICYLVSRPKKVNERMLTMMALIGCFCMRHLVRASIVRYMCRICICLAEMSTIYQLTPSTVVPANSDSDVVPCLQLLSKTPTRTCYLSWGESIDHSCISPILRIGLIHK